MKKQKSEPKNKGLSCFVSVDLKPSKYYTQLFVNKIYNRKFANSFFREECLIRYALGITRKN